LGSADERRAPELSALVSGAEGGLDVATRRFELFDRVARRLFVEAEDSGLLVVLDDLHWPISRLCCYCAMWRARSTRPA